MAPPVFFVAGLGSMYHCASLCSKNGATMPCFRSDADVYAFASAVKTQAPKAPVAWTGFYQSVDKLGEADGWSVPRSQVPLNWVAPWCAENGTTWSIYWREGEPLTHPDVPLGCAFMSTTDWKVNHAGCEYSMLGSWTPACVCQRPPEAYADWPLETAAFKEFVSAAHDKEHGFFASLQWKDFKKVQMRFIPLLCFIVIFLQCLLFRSCWWARHLEEWGPVDGAEALAAPRDIIFDNKADHMQARAAHSRVSKQCNTDSFDALRGIASLQVSIGHFFDSFGPNLYAKGDLGGVPAVLMFFVMSGFVLQLGYAGKGPADGSCIFGCIGCGGRFAKSFWARRIARLGPVAWLSLVLSVPIYQYGKLPTHVGLLPGFAQNLFLSEAVAANAMVQQNWIPGMDVNGPLWQLTALSLFYLFFPTLMDRCHSIKSTRTLVTSVVALWIVYVVLWLRDAEYDPLRPGMLVATHLASVNKLPLCIAGMLMGSEALLQIAHAGPQSRRWGFVAGLVALFLMLHAVVCAFANEFMEDGRTKVLVLGSLALPPFYLLLLYALVRSPLSLTARIMSWAPFRFLGKISFCIYVLHVPIFENYFWFRRHQEGNSYFDGTTPRHSSWADALVVLLLVLTSSSLAYYFVEEPGRKCLQRLLEQPKRAPASVKGDIKQEPAVVGQASGHQANRSRIGTGEP